MNKALELLHGDSWVSPCYAVFINGAVFIPDDWFIHAAVRKGPADTESLFTWTVANGGVLVDSAEVQRSDGVELETGTVQLRLRPSAWNGKPRSWSGMLDIQISSDDSDDPEQRHTIVSKLPFRISPDIDR